jgi:hypothetical protein
VLALAWGLVLAARSPSHPAVLALVLAWCASGAVDLAIEGGLRGWSARAALAAGALALAVQLGSAARPVMPAASVPARPGLEALASDLERIAVLKGREATEMPTVVLGEGEDRALRWALRRARSLRQSLVRPPQAEDVKRPALVLLGGGAAATPPVGYVGTTYGSAAGPVHLWVPID